MTIAPTHTAPVTGQPQAVSPSWAWALKRTALGLFLMMAMTMFATFLANASIEPTGELPQTISIGLPAAALLNR